MKYLLLLLLLPLSIHAETLKIASWNIAWLGSHKFNKRTPVDYMELARYAKQLDADVIALQEVENAEYARKVFGDKYNYYFSKKDWVQRVGVAVKKSIGYKATSTEYKALDVGRVRYGLDVTLSKEDKRLSLLAVHLKSGCFDEPLDIGSIKSMPETSKREYKIKNACTKLSKQIEPLETWIDSRAKENTPFLVLGDFNRRFNKDIEKKHNESEGFWQAIDDEGEEDMWSPTITSESACWGGYYKDYIDHIILSPKAKEKFVNSSFNQLVFEQEYSKKSSQNLSDHCPISLKLNL